MEKPKIRFGKFNSKWKKNKLDEVVDFFDNQRIPIDSGERKDGPYPYYGASGIIDYVDGYIFNGEYVLLAEDGANIILRSSPIAYLSKGKFWLNNHAHIMRMKTGSNEFLIQLLEKQNYEKYNTGTAQPKLNGEVVKNITLNYPSDEEQSAIGSLFCTLDDLLFSYKDNLANYQSLKATMLSKMFPKAGHTLPEIRLNGFNSEWECLKIAEIFQIIDGDRGKSYPGESDFYSVGHTLFLDTGNVKKSGLDFSTTKFISEEKDKELRNGKLILGDFILTSRGTLGNVAYYNENIQKRYSSVRINSAMLILRPLLGDKISPDYILAVLRGNLISDFMKVNQVGSAQPHITKKEFSKIKVLVPSNIQEQQAIGTYFSNLDNLIKSYREKISQLETLKKKLLQDMFI